MNNIIENNSKDPAIGNLSPNWKENIHYRDGYKVIRFIVNLQAIVALVLVAILSFMVITAKNKDRYYAKTIENINIPMFALDYPNMTRGALADWVSRAAVQVMTFGFNNLDKRFDISKKNFTDKGWQAFRKVAIKSKLIETTIDNQQLITAAPASVPVIVKEGIMKGKYRWIFEMKILLTFRSGGVKQNSIKNLRIVIEKTPTWNNPVGVGIAEWYMY